MLLYLDIETLPGDSDTLMKSLRDDAEKEKATVRPPSNYKDESKIAEYIAAKHAEIDATIEEKRRKTSFDGMYGRIACIAWALDDGPVKSTLTAHDEREAIRDFYFSIVNETRVTLNNGEASYAVTVVGHNVAGFDLPFLKHRSIILGIRPPAPIYRAMQAKPWDGCIADTMLMWSADREKRASMDKLCRALGIQGKGDFDGGMVADTWPDNPQKVIDYCKDDVQRTREIYRRLSFS
jgi:hypothetical protein